MVEFALVAALTTTVLASVLQLGLSLHVRATLVDCAAEGARYAGMADREPEDGAARTRELISSALAPAYAADVSAERTTVHGVDVIRVEVDAPLPLLGLLGPARTLQVRAHALDESRLAP